MKNWIIFVVSRFSFFWFGKCEFGVFGVGSSGAFSEMTLQAAIALGVSALAGRSLWNNSFEKPSLPPYSVAIPSATFADSTLEMDKLRRVNIQSSTQLCSPSMASRLISKLRVDVPILREIMAEFLGTYVLVLLGDASIAQSSLTDSKNGDFFSINWGWGIGVMMGALIAGSVSAGHLNPAVSLAMASVGKFPLIKVPAYWLAQYLGALAAAASVLGVYSEAIQYKTNGDLTITNENPGTAGIFATYPAVYLSAQGGLGDQILGTMMLLLCICAITDKRNSKVPSSLVPMYIGFVILVIGICFGANCGYAINPARDLAPRLITLFAGWGEGVFSFRNYNWFWVPIIGPHIGALLGVLVYILFIEAHWPEEEGDDAARASDESSSAVRKSEKESAIEMEDM